MAQSKYKWWGKTDYKGAPWVYNDSHPAEYKHGLAGRHIALWASHGRYFSSGAEGWKWQRVNLFGTNEDLFTQTFVVPYLIPMLERAGANVFTPRERDWQVHETVIDNDGAMMMVDGKVTNGAATNYVEDGNWNNYRTSGFQIPYHGLLHDGDTPFSQGTARFVNTTKKKKASAFTIYSPELKEAGRYAVYVSYQTMAESVDDAHYIVVHRGIETHFRVNQQMGSGTWVYLGTFDFDNAASMDNCVIIDNQSSRKGVVTTDAVRFGGGMGNVERGRMISGLPRCLEGARYSAEWGGAPYSVYSSKNGGDDYADDINVRSLMTNWLAGGSVYVPDREGKNVPIELSLAVHSDAGFHRDFSSIYGSLGICTTNFNDERLASGHSRFYSRDFIESVLAQVEKDMRRKYGRWSVRNLYDRNYSESRLPAMPSAIIELLSHQSFPDMVLAHDPQFKFDVSRAIYKAILRFICNAHGIDPVIAPLQPIHLSAMLDERGKVHLNWKEQGDELEPSAKAKRYIVYTAKGNGGFDNGKKVKGTSFTMEVEENTTYRFRVTAINDGGESFPSEEMAVFFNPEAKHRILVVNAFHRLSSPYVRREVNGSSYYGFDLDADPGVSYGLTAGWVGRQQVFSSSTAGREGAGTFGYSGNELAGHFIAGNDFNYVSSHVEAIAEAGNYSVMSCSSTCSEITQKEDINHFHLIDLILGNERNDGHSLKPYKTFTPSMQQALRKYKGAIIASGSYVVSDNLSASDSAFVADILHVKYRSQYRSSDATVNGLGTSFSVLRNLNPKHYASTISDVIGIAGEREVISDSITTTISEDSLTIVQDTIHTHYFENNLPDAFVAMSYSDGQSAAVAYKGVKNSTFTVGFPLECISEERQRKAIIKAIINWSLNP